MRKRSEEIHINNCSVIPGGVNSPARSFQAVCMSPPLIISSGLGDTIIDADGKQYIDYCGSWGSLILGHAHPTIVSAAQNQMALGSSFGIATEIEGEMAKTITRLIPSIEKIRFVSSGTEATMTAMRLARGFTNRPKIVKFSGHYHGHSDALLIQAGSGVASLNSTATSKGVNPGVIADTICLPFNDFKQAKELFSSPTIAHQIGAVILEPVAGNMGTVLPEHGFLEMLREETKKIGALLIFDEVITGFRVGISGVQGLYHITPDLTCLGKIIGGGFPAAAVGGKKEIMDYLAPLGPVYQAGTLSGNPIAMKAGLETLRLIQTPNFYQDLLVKTNRLTKPLQELLNKQGSCLQQCGSMFSIFFGLSKVSSKEDLKDLDEKQFIQFFKYLFDKGIYIPPSSQEAWFVSSSHSEEHIDYTLDTIQSFLKNKKN
jgi:glutamate-1-semialdehyde 2,1-aminomutase